MYIHLMNYNCFCLYRYSFEN